MTTGEKVGSVALLLAVSVGIYYKFFRKGAEVAEAAKGGGGGGSSSGSSSVGRMPSVMVADVSPVVAVSSVVRPPSRSKVNAPAPIGRPNTSTTTTTTTSIPRPIAPISTVDAAPKPAPIGVKLPTGVSVSADGYSWR